MNTTVVDILNDPLKRLLHAFLVGADYATSSLGRSTWCIAYRGIGRCVVNSDGPIMTERNGGIWALEMRGLNSVSLRVLINLAGIDSHIWDEAARVHPKPIEICGPLTVAAYRAAWMPELDEQGRRVPRKRSE